MLFDDSYKTINGVSEGIFRDKGSKFLAYAYPIKKVDAIKDIIQQLKAEHPKANHHCWAIRLTSDRSIYKINDDGEPSGTAGRPILNALLSADLTDILIVVVRYFGGTLLGVPGLIHAYKTATADVIQNAEVVVKTINDIYEIRFEHEWMNPVMRIVKTHELKIISQDYEDQNILKIEIRKGAVNNVLADLNNLRKITVNYLYSE